MRTVEQGFARIDQRLVTLEREFIAADTARARGTLEPQPGALKMADTIHTTDHYAVRQPADDSFLIVPRSADAREVLAEILHEQEFDLERDPIREDGSCRIRRDNPFGLVHTIEHCEARIAIVETLRYTESAPASAGNTSAEPNSSAPGA